MKAMVFAAGLGTRLRPLTNDRPKALVEIGGSTLLEIALRRLRSFGVTDVIVNVHHFADKVTDYLRSRDFGMRIEISREDVLLDTGGGLKKAMWFFLEDGGEEPFIVHNVDVLSAIDLHGMLAYHKQHNALATLAVQQRTTSRYLLFDDRLQLCGRRAGEKGDEEIVCDSSVRQALAFSGIHVISPRLLSRITEEGVFSIIPVYLRLAAAGEKIVGMRNDGVYWRDLGKLEHIAQAERDVTDGRVVL